MSEWKVIAADFDATSRAVFTVTKGSRKLDHREQEELEALLANAAAVRQSLSNLVGLAKLGAAPLHQYEAAIKSAEQALSK